MSKEFISELCKTCKRLVTSDRRLNLNEFEQLKTCRCLQLNKREVKYHEEFKRVSRR